MTKVTTTADPPTQGVQFYKYSWAVLLSVAFAYALDVFMRYNIPTVIPHLMEEYGWDPVTVGWVDSAYLWAYALMQVPWSIISERWLGMRWTVMIGTALITIAGILFAFNASNLGWGIAARAMIGVGAAAIWVPAYPAISRWFAPSRRGIMTGIIGSGANIGTFAGSALMPILLTSSPILFGLSQLESGFLWSAIPGILALILVILFARNRPEDVGLKTLDGSSNIAIDDAASSSDPTFGLLLRTSFYPYLMCLIYMGALGALTFTATWLPTYLSDAYKINLKALGLLFGLASVVPGILGVYASGFFADKFAKTLAIRLAFTGTTVMAIALAIVAAIGAVVPVALTIGVYVVFSFFSSMWVLTWPFTSIMFPISAGASIGGLMNTAAQLMAAAAPVIGGALLTSTGSYVGVFIASAVCAGIALIATRALRDERVV
jgi:ACS family D-galactonate transporter-like MFS transporter